MRVKLLSSTDRQLVTIECSRKVLIRTDTSTIRLARIDGEGDGEDEDMPLVLKTYPTPTNKKKLARAIQELNLSLGAVMPPHPNVLRGVAGRKTDTHIYIAFPFATQHSLTEVLHIQDVPVLDSISDVVALTQHYIRHKQKAPSTQKSATPSGVKKISIQLLRAIRHMHAHGYVHRDIKFDNILVTADGTVVLADFGLAAPIMRACGRAGTLVSMAPEMWVQHGKAPMRESLDVWSAGCLIHMLCTGQHPFGLFTFGVAHLREEVMHDMYLDRANPTRVVPDTSMMSPDLASLYEISLLMLSESVKARPTSAAALRLIEATYTE